MTFHLLISTGLGDEYTEVTGDAYLIYDSMIRLDVSPGMYRHSYNLMHLAKNLDKPLHIKTALGDSFLFLTNNHKDYVQERDTLDALQRDRRALTERG